MSISNYEFIEPVQTDLLYVHPDLAVAEVSLYLGDELLVATGTSKRDTADKPDVALGALLAYGRALESLSNKLLRRATGRVKHNDDMRDAKQLKADLYTKTETTLKCGDQECWCA